MLITLVILTCISSAIIGGVFYAFSTFVMRALSELPHRSGIEAMQRINVVVINPLFLGVFMGAGVLSLICIVVALFDWNGIDSLLLLLGGCLYLVGTFGVTMVFNVPRNDALSQYSADSPEAASYWLTYLQEWTMWNHVRMAAAIMSAICLAAFLTLL